MRKEGGREGVARTVSLPGFRYYRVLRYFRHITLHFISFTVEIARPDCLLCYKALYTVLPEARAVTSIVDIREISDNK